jgi:hypothetical protein
MARIKLTARKTTGGYTSNLPRHRNTPTPVPNTQRDPTGPGLITNAGIRASSSDPPPIPRVILVSTPGQVLPSRRSNRIALHAPAPAPTPEPESQPEPEPESPPVKKPRYKTPRSYPNRPKSFKTDGGIAYTKAQSNTGNAGSWTISYRCFRKSGFATRAEAAAKLKYWKDNNICPGCNQTIPI